MAATYQAMSGGRLMINIVIGAEPAELARFGDHLPKGRALPPLWESSSPCCAAPSGRPRSTSTATSTGSRPPPPATSPSSRRRSLRWRARRPRRSPHPRRHVPAVGRTARRSRRAAERMGGPRPRPATPAGSSSSASASTSSPATLRTRLSRGGPAAARHGPRRGGPRRGPTSLPPPRSANGAWPTCTPRSTACPEDPAIREISPNLWAGVGLVRGGAGTVLAGSPPRSRTGSRTTTAWGSGSSSCRATRTWRRRARRRRTLPEPRRRRLIGPAPHAPAEVFTFR